MNKRLRRTIPRLASGLLLLSALHCGGGSSGDPPAHATVPAPAARLAADDPDDVHRELRRACETIRDSANEYYGTAQIEELEDFLRQSVDHPEARATIRARLGVERLRIGDPAAAVSLLAEALKIAESAALEKPLVLDIRRLLALSHLRLGETSNCVGRHGPASCIVPFSEEALHVDRSGSLAAISHYRAFLAEVPDDPLAAWLLNVAAMTIGRHPADVPATALLPADRLRSEHEVGLFPDVAWKVGLRIRQPSGGAIMDDFDGDGLLDVVTSTIDPCRPMTFHRNDGRGAFVERTAQAGLDRQLGGLNMIHADFDNDGDSDLFVLRGGWFGADGRIRNSLLRNDGSGRFDDVTRSAGLDAPAYPTQAGGWADYDNDGDLDLYVGNEADHEGVAYPSQLFRNNGDGTFSDVAEAAGVRNDRFTKSVAWGDYDNDGDRDLYLSNIGPNRLYRNNGDGTFNDVAEESGTTRPEGRSFPAWFFDFDNDGWLDLFVADYGATRETVAASLLGRPTSGGHPLLYRNTGNGRFEEVSETAGLTAPSLPMGSNFGDLDNDGWLDFYLGTGDPGYDSIAPNRMYRNDRGERFQDATYSGGFGHLQKGHGVAFGDVDQDGDQDVFEQMGGAYPGDAYPSVLYENPGHGNRWITLLLVGETSNRSAIGARIRVTVDATSGRREIHVVAGSGGPFGGSSLQQEIGLGDAASVASIEILWPGSGSRQRFTGLELDRFYEIHEGRSEPVRLPRQPFTLGPR